MSENYLQFQEQADKRKVCLCFFQIMERIKEWRITEHSQYVFMTVIIVITVVACAVVQELFVQFLPRAYAGSLAPLDEDFMWGVATSAFQSEGNSPPSNWTNYIRSGHLQPIGTSVDFYHRYPEDITLAKNLGVKVFRLGIEWSRLEKRKGEWDQAEWRYYDAMLSAITKAGMRPMITLDHWVYPEWEFINNGWAQSSMVDDWLSYARRVVDRAVKYNPLWITFNEPEFYIANEIENGTISPLTTLATMIQGLSNAHNQIYSYIHHIQPHAMVSSNIALISSLQLPLPGIINFITHSLDYISFDFYYTVRPNINTISAFARKSMWTITPETEGVYYMSRYFTRNFSGKPLYITENGLPTNNGASRADGYTPSAALSDTIYWIQRAKADGMNIIGYNYWSITDNYEWGSFAPRFGLYTVDALKDRALKRHPTDTVETYKQIITKHGVPEGYRLTHTPKPCNNSGDQWGCNQLAQP